MNINKIDICNMALSLMGADTISDMSEPSKEARACSIFYENTKNKALCKYDWPFASKTLKLNKLKSGESSLSNRFRLPADCLAPRQFMNERTPELFRREGNCIITELDEAILRYTCSLDETSVFPPDFIDGLAYLLASDMAVFLTDSPEAAQMFAAASEKKLEEASSSAALFTSDESSFTPFIYKISGKNEKIFGI